MKFLILAVCVAVASAQLRSDVFQVGSTGAFKKTAFLQAEPQFAYSAQPLIAGKYASAKYVSEPVYSTFAAQPALFNKQYTAKYVSEPVYSTFAAQPALVNKQYTIKSAAAPVYTSFAAQPTLVNKQYTIKSAASPVYTSFAAQPALVNKQYTIKSAYSPLVAESAYAALQKPVYSHEYAQKIAQPALSQRFYQDSLSTYASNYNGANFGILSQTQDADPSGNYKASFATENGIQAAEEGALINGAEGPVVASQGAYSYTAPDGVQYTVNWVADENGYRASGAHLPQAPAIPEEIQRSLAFNANNAEKYDEQGRLLIAKA